MRETGIKSIAPVICRPVGDLIYLKAPEFEYGAMCSRGEMKWTSEDGTKLSHLRSIRSCKYRGMRRVENFSNKIESGKKQVYNLYSVMSVKGKRSKEMAKNCSAFLCSEEEKEKNDWKESSQVGQKQNNIFMAALREKEKKLLLIHSFVHSYNAALFSTAARISNFELCWR